MITYEKYCAVFPIGNSQSTAVLLLSCSCQYHSHQMKFSVSVTTAPHPDASLAHLVKNGQFEFEFSTSN